MAPPSEFQAQPVLQNFPFITASSSAFPVGELHPKVIPAFYEYLSRHILLSVAMSEGYLYQQNVLGWQSKSVLHGSPWSPSLWHDVVNGQVASALQASSTSQSSWLAQVSPIWAPLQNPYSQYLLLHSKSAWHFLPLFKFCLLDSAVMHWAVVYLLGSADYSGTPVLYFCF